MDGIKLYCVHKCVTYFAVSKHPSACKQGSIPHFQFHVTRFLRSRVINQGLTPIRLAPFSYPCRGVRHGTPRRTRFRNPLDFTWISDFRMDFWISDWISAFHSGFLDFWISVWISADGVRDFFRRTPRSMCPRTFPFFRKVWK